MNFNVLKPYFDSMPVAFTVIEIVLDENEQPCDWIFRYANPALAQLEKLNFDALLGKRFFTDLFSDNHDVKWLKYYYAAAFLNQTHELHEFSPEIGKHLRIVCYPWTERGYCACVLYDETVQVRALRRLEYLAYYDKKTKFSNRNAYTAFLNTFKTGDNVGVIFIDVNELKTVNDRYGHDTGNFLIDLVCDRIYHVFNDIERIFRIGGDEFVIVLLDIDQTCCENKARFLQEQMSNSDIANLPAVLASVGWSWASQTDSLKELVHEADVSMYQEKHKYHSEFGGFGGGQHLGCKRRRAVSRTACRLSRTHRRRHIPHRFFSFFNRTAYCLHCILRAAPACSSMPLARIYNRTGEKSYGLTGTVPAVARG